MIKRYIQKTISPLILRLSKKFSSNPNRLRVFDALSALRQKIKNEPGKRGYKLNIDKNSKIIIFSDQHRGAKDLADDFRLAEPNYKAALEWYLAEGYTLISLGDSEEFWENTVQQVKKHNQATFKIEKEFHEQNRFYKVFGNHDLFWDNDPLASFHLNDIYGSRVKIYEGILLNYTQQQRNLEILLTHGHQGDKSSDGNWFSKWFISIIWAPLQIYLEINPNTPAYNTEHKSHHNQIMYEWVAEQDNLILITGHTHQPIFQSLTYIERLYLQLELARESQNKSLQNEIEEKLAEQLKSGETIPTYKAFKQSYFNTGCCCFSDGDITGLELVDGKINLVKWRFNVGLNKSEKVILEEADLVKCVNI